MTRDSGAGGGEPEGVAPKACDVDQAGRQGGVGCGRASNGGEGPRRWRWWNRQ